MDRPILEEHLHTGTIWVDGSEYVGKASDGVEVSIGYVGQEGAAERYLTANPTPDNW